MTVEFAEGRLADRIAPASALGPDPDSDFDLGPDCAALPLASEHLPTEFSHEIELVEVRPVGENVLAELSHEHGLVEALLVAEIVRAAISHGHESVVKPLGAGNSLSSISRFRSASLSREVPSRVLLVLQPQSAQVTLVVRRAVAASTHRCHGMVIDDLTGCP